MPQDPVVWIVLIAAVAVVFALAVWFGRGITVRKDDKGFELTVQESNPQSKQNSSQQSNNQGVSVGEGLVIKGSKVGDIAGIKGASQSGENQPVTVAKNAQIEASEVGDIAGVKKP